jgi:isopenicillin N synthase-like dioxygenase
MTAGDHVRLTKRAPHPTDSNHIGLVAHTDFGSITILFNWLGGLQIKSKSPQNLGEWEYVKPLANHAICNLGDAMVKFTSGELKSAKHRVVPAPGEQATVDRYSVVYFMRPADETKLKAVYGSEVGKETELFTSKEWIGRRVIELQGGKK